VRDESEEEIAAEDIGSEDVIALDGGAWEHIARGRHETELLDLAETDGMPAVTAWLDARGLGWSPARRAVRYPRGELHEGGRLGRHVGAMAGGDHDRTRA
jgi:hypothetical protein